MLSCHSAVMSLGVRAAASPSSGPAVITVEAVDFLSYLENTVNHFVSINFK